jgi:outer membrane protein OmpA-like peptidoglycan-associated protein
MVFEFGRIPGLLWAVLLPMALSSCFLYTPNPWWLRAPASETVQLIDSPLPPPKVSRNDRITLIPKANGSVGAVVVRQGNTEILLDKAYASVHIQGHGLVTEEIYQAEHIPEEYSEALQAQPSRPEKFLVYFMEGTDILTEESEAEITRIIEAIATRPAPDISLIGHTDSVGTRPFNEWLSLQRAERVRSVLIEHEIDESAMTVAGRGENELLVPTDDGVNEPRNRRVEIDVR